MTLLTKTICFFPHFETLVKIVNLLDLKDIVNKIKSIYWPMTLATLTIYFFPHFETLPSKRGLYFYTMSTLYTL